MRGIGNVANSMSVTMLNTWLGKYNWLTLDWFLLTGVHKAKIAERCTTEAVCISSTDRCGP